MTEKVRDKIRKCLAIANDEGAHEAEALSALTMARRLMAAHKIGAHEIDLEQPDEIVKIGTPHRFHSRLDPWIASLANVIFDRHCCRGFFSQRHRKQTRRLWILGYSRDVEVALMALNYAIDTIRLRLVDIRRHHSGFRAEVIRHFCNSYAMGFICGLEEAYDAQDLEQLEGSEFTTAIVMQMPEEISRVSFPVVSDTKVSYGNNRHYAEGMVAGRNHLCAKIPEAAP